MDPEGFAAVNKSINEAVAAAPSSDRSSVSYSSSDDPGMYDATDYSCNPFKDKVSGLRIKYGVEYLRKIKGTPGQGPGPVCLTAFNVDPFEDGSWVAKSVPRTAAAV